MLTDRCLQGHVRKAQALVSLGRTEEALREYLICLSIEPDCKLAKAETLKVNPTSVGTCSFIRFIESAKNDTNIYNNH